MEILSLNKARQVSSEVVKTRDDDLNEQYMIIVEVGNCLYPDALRVSTEKCLCCAYDQDDDLYVCSYAGHPKDVLINGGKEQGPAVSTCRVPENMQFS